MPTAPARADGLRGAGPTSLASPSFASALAGAVVPARSLLLAPSPTPGPDPRRDAPGTAAGPAAWPLPPALATVLPGGLRHGSTVRVEGSTSLLLALMAEASAAGAWCGAVGLESLNAVAADEAGVDLDRLALVPRPRETWPTVVAALLDAIDVVAVAPPVPRSAAAARRATAAVARRLSTRAHERRGVLLVVGDADAWTTADVELTAVACRWDGLGQGHGHLRERSLDVRVTGRRAGGGAGATGAGRARTATLDLPAPSSLPLTPEGVPGDASRQPGPRDRAVTP